MMAGAPRNRLLLLGVALLATLAATVWVSGRAPDGGSATLVAPVRPPAPAGGSAAAPPGGSNAAAPAEGGAASPVAAKPGNTAADALPSAAPAPRPASAGEIADLFPRQSWFVPPPPPPPSAPPLPFAYLGQYIDGPTVVVFVSSGERNFAVRQGDVIDGSYRVDSIAPPTMTFTYLPLNQKQTLEIGRAN